MPHLAPLNWLAAPIMFFFLLMILISNLWWSKMPKFQKPQMTMKSSLNKKWAWK